MNKESFLNVLGDKLNRMGCLDAKRRLDYYSEMIDDRIEDGLSEEQAVAAVGDMDEITPKVMNELSGETNTSPRGRGRAIKFIAGGILALAVVTLLWQLVIVPLLAGSKIESVYAVAEGIQRVSIDASSSDVVICKTDGDEAIIECTERERLKFDIQVNGGSLVIKQKSRWYFFGGGIGGFKLKLYLPEDSCESIEIGITSGDMKLSDVDFAKANINSTSGDITLANTNLDACVVKTTSGNISLDGVNKNGVGSLQIDVTSGNVSINDAALSLADIEVTSGKVRLSSVNCQNLKVESTSGDIRLEDVLAEGSMTMDVTSGDVKIQNCDAESVKIETTSGDVEGVFLSEKIIYASAVSGRIDVPRFTNGGICEINTVSGDITITVK